MMQRNYAIDNIRWMTVVLVVIYHVFYLFNAAGVPGGFPAFTETQYQDILLYLVYPWFMVLLFLIAGIAARYSLQKRTPKQFIGSRTTKLLVPATLGLFVFQWMGGWFNVSLGGGWDYMPDTMPLIIKYLICAVSGIGPLWFAQMLWLFSLLLLIVRRMDKKERFYHLCGRANMPVILLLMVVLWGAAQVGNTPVITMYRFGIYFAAFLIGYFVFSHDNVQERVQTYRIPLLIAAAVTAVGYTVYYFGADYTSDKCLKSLFTAVYLWIAILAILGCAKQWYHSQGKAAAYFTKVSFGIYVLHYPVMLAVCWLLRNVLALPAVAIYILAIVLTFVLTVGLYEILHRIPVLRYCILGEK